MSVLTSSRWFRRGVMAAALVATGALTMGAVPHEAKAQYYGYYGYYPYGYSPYYSYYSPYYYPYYGYYSYPAVTVGWGWGWHHRYWGGRGWHHGWHRR